MAKGLVEVKKKSQLDGLVASIEKQYGRNSAARGGLQRELRSIPTSSIALDYELGTGGWPIGYISTVYGARDLGKSSFAGLGAVKNAQAMGLNCVWIAVEPVGGEQWTTWLIANGVNPKDLLILYPENSEEAISMLIECSGTPDVGLIVFDSIGALVSKKQIEEDGKPRVGGQASLVTLGISASAPLVYKNEICCLILNQVRDVIGMNTYGALKMPGGHALEHHSSIIVQLKKGKEKYNVKLNGTEIQIGQQMVAHIQRNKHNQGTGHKAVFDYYFMEADGHSIGVDTFSDAVNTAKRVGSIQQSGSFFTLPNGKKLQGFDAVKEYLIAQPEVFGIVREEVLKAMLNRNSTEEVGDVESDNSGD